MECSALFRSAESGPDVQRKPGFASVNMGIGRATPKGHSSRARRSIGAPLQSQVRCGQELRAQGTPVYPDGKLTETGGRAAERPFASKIAPDWQHPSASTARDCA